MTAVRALPSFLEINDDLAAAWCHTPWAATDMSYDGDAYHGVFDVDLASDVSDRAPYRPVLHGSILAQIVSYHTLASMLYAYTNDHVPALATLPKVALPEARKRIVVTSLKLSLRREVAQTRVPVRLTIDRVTDKWDSHRMAFAVLSVDVAGGLQTAELEGCFNFRDRIER
ncbi:MULTISPECIES: hypothetical protein [Streptomyces]|uniref:hypothetical protein n=1 Tax=Streptomyces TaxID=1883 RepID=UPI00102E9966|nr:MULTISPECIES: hypothetical protein [Streptomyces]MYS67568.1 hypothetical protein [Streptomyces sp. SID5473]TAI44541.1 hypothetical protein EWI31_13855 [Streptomyces tsukubensis]